MDAVRETQIQEKRAPRLVLFPLPFQGHINPMMQLATLLHSKGFSITIIHTHFNSPNSSNFPNFQFEPIYDGLSEDQASSDDPVTLAAILNDTCQVPFDDRLSRLILDGPITSIITDVLWYFPQAIADRLKLRRIVLRTNSATYTNAMASFIHLHPSIHDYQSDSLVPELAPLRLKDLPDFSSVDRDTVERLAFNVKRGTSASSGIIVNTFEGLEQTALEKLRQDNHLTPIFAIGPLHKFSPDSSSSLLTQDHNCIAWLDKQAPQSVIYVSFGTLAHVSETTLVEIAWGLANSEQPFLWVVRPGSVDGQDLVELPQEFEEQIRERGLIVKWAPQVEVLSHPSVGGFWTHNGWNSTIESIGEGVPMICCPYSWDQKVIARYASHVWKVGLQLENGFERVEIERAIRKLMLQIEGEEIREGARNLKEEAARCVKIGGSSYDSLENLIGQIVSF